MTLVSPILVKFQQILAATGNPLCSPTVRYEYSVGIGLCLRKSASPCRRLRYSQAVINVGSLDESGLKRPNSEGTSGSWSDMVSACL